MESLQLFEVSIDRIEKFTEVLSKGRVRIFYKYGNRNGAYITDEFADKLVATLPYTPVKGIYEQEEKDYTDHGTRRDLGRIYGIVPENCNFAWEEHTDDDGVTRTYATADVLLFTALYGEASEIYGKAQSMELYAPSIKGDWAIIDGRKQFVYTDACFLGLQVLGESVEPCFEGAAFFSLNDVEKMKDFVNQLQEGLRQYELTLEGGHNKMENIFKLSHDAIDSKLFQALNPNFNEEHDYELSYALWQVYDNYAVCGVVGTEDTVRVYYTVENDQVVLGEMEPCHIIDVNETEYQTVETIRQLSNHSLENVVETYGKIETLESDILERDNKIATLETEQLSVVDNFNAQIEGLNSTVDSLNATIEGLNGDIEGLNNELNELHTFKAGVERQEKMAVINEYASVLSQEILDQYTEKLDEFTVRDLDKELAYEVKQSAPNAFIHAEEGKGIVPKDEPLSGITALLSKYEHKK